MNTPHMGLEHILQCVDEAHEKTLKHEQIKIVMIANAIAAHSLQFPS